MIRKAMPCFLISLQGHLTGLGTGSVGGKGDCSTMASPTLFKASVSKGKRMANNWRLTLSFAKSLHFSLFAHFDSDLSASAFL